MSIQRVPPNSELLAQVKQLGRAHARTLGFLPEGAFDAYAAQGSVLALVDQDQVQAYTVYRVRGRALILVHLCVADSARGQGFARALVDELARTPGFGGIQANCRADYEADKVWPRLGFSVRREVPGRSKKKRTVLRVWWRDLDLPDLFTSIPTATPVAALDMNVLIDMQAPVSPETEEAKALRMDWVPDVVDLVITDEIYIEIKRQSDKSVRRRRREFASGYRTLFYSSELEVQEVVSELEEVIGGGISASERSDRHHLAKSILGSAQFFVTQDQGLLDHADEVQARWAIAIVRPCDLVALSDEELLERSRVPARLAGSGLSARAVLPSDIDRIVPLFQDFASREKLGPFRGLLRRAVARPTEFDCCLVVAADEEPEGLLVTSRESERFEVHLLRTRRGRPIGDVLAQHLLWMATRRAATTAASVIRITDDYAATAARASLEELGYRIHGGVPEKLIVRGVFRSDDLARTIRGRGELSDDPWLEGVADLLDRPALDLSPDIVAGLEKAFWPAKLTNLGLPCFLVPIQPEWAAQLFHEHLANQSLFGADPALMLRLENVYFRSPRPRRVEAPGRVLWYVVSSRESPDSKCVVGTSYVTEVVRGPAKEIFGRLRRFGVYQWKDILRLAGQRPMGEIAAFRFGHTELFDRPVALETVRAIIRDTENKAVVLQSPTQLTSESFTRIYESGMAVSA